MKLAIESCVDQLAAIAQANNVQFDVAVDIAVTELPGGLSYRLTVVWAGERILSAAGKTLQEVAEAAARRMPKMIKEYQLVAPPDLAAEPQDDLAPFRALAAGIPPNWPDGCILVIDHEEAKEQINLSYARIGKVGAPTIAQWRNLL